MLHVADAVQLDQGAGVGRLRGAQRVAAGDLDRHDVVGVAVHEQLGNAQREPLDLDRVTAIGHSAGGHLALWAAGRPSRVRLSAAVSQAGLLDLREAARRNLSDGAVHELLGGSPEERPDRYDAASPIELVPLDVPTLLVHGTDDEVVPPEMSRAYARCAPHSCELVEPAGTGHMEHLDPGSEAWRPVTEWLEER